MKHLLFFLFLFCSSFAASQTVSVSDFAAFERDFGGRTICYRKAQIAPVDGEMKALVIYLHGGSSCGTDNVAQMNEPGIEAIASYLQTRAITSVMLVPQCPERNLGWGGLARNVKEMIDFIVRTEGIDPDRIYLFGGSMGGTGTWKMLSSYPSFFAAAMPCAANPSGMDAEKVSTTPVYNVMGLADRIMAGDVRETAEAFVAQLKNLGDDVVYETVEGWSHEMTCTQSYTPQRLDWVFAHQRNGATGIAPVLSPSDSSGATGWYTLQGQLLEHYPMVKGVYIHQGRKVLIK